MGLFRRKPKEPGPIKLVFPEVKWPEGEFELTVVGPSGRHIVNRRIAIVAKQGFDMGSGRHRLTIQLPRKRPSKHRGG